MTTEKRITVRHQTWQKDYTKERLYVFTTAVVVLLVCVLGAHWLSPYDPNAQDLQSALQAPSSVHWLGTDRYGRDMFSRVLVGGQVSIFATLLLVAIMASVGSLIGVCCAYVGGKVEDGLMRLADLCLAFPGLVFAMAIAAVLQGGVQNAVLALAAIGWPKYARIARSLTLSLRQENFIFAAQMAGSSPWQIMYRHILPNMMGPIVVTAVLDIGTMMMEIAGLSFLGLGAKPPVAEWGSMMSVGRSMLQTHPWVVLGPGGAIFITVVLFNLLGDTLRDYLDPKRT